MKEENCKKKSLSLCLNNLTNQICALSTKNFFLFSRNRYISILVIACPFFLCLYLHQIQSIVDDNTLIASDENPTEITISKIPKCINPNCLSIGIGLISGKSSWTDYIINHLSKTSDLELNKDIKVLTERNATEFIDYLNEHQNQIQIGLLLCNDLIGNNDNYTIFCDENHGYVYTIIYNFTIISTNIIDINIPDPINKCVLAVKLAMDNAIFNYKAKQKGFTEIFIELILQYYPKTANKFIKGYDSIALHGPFYFFIPSIFIFGLLLSELVKEKELQLRNGLSVIGVSSISFWISWFIIAVIFAFLNTNSLILSGYIFGFDVFIQTPYFLMFFLFFLFILTMIMLGFMLSTMINSVKLSYTISYSFLLGGLVLQSFFTSKSLMRLFHIDDLPYWLIIVRYVFRFYPPFNFSIIFGDIGAKAGALPNNYEGRWEKGPGYFWDDFFLIRKGIISGNYYSIPSSYSTMIDLIWNFATFIVLTWYFDNIISENKGRSKPLWFMLTKNYWNCKEKKKTLFESDSGETEKYFNNNNNEKNTSQDVFEGLRLDGIWKSYSKSAPPVVKPLEFTIENNELVAIIGHNGAGKTTLLKMLTGLLSPSGGTAHYLNYDLGYDLDKIHQIIGYCPQFNILWDELTAREHLKLFAKLRNTPKELRNDLINQKLSEVNLTNAGNKLVGTYSGGMKRRLSVAISSIGNPKIIFMDEPTTGMDPITRREVWKFIKNLKKDKVIILTTHSMEEAEILSDRVIVMVNGEIKCSGTCLYLKSHYGDDYKAELIADKPQELWEYLEKNMPSIQIINISGSSLFVSIPRTEVNDVQKFFTSIENNKINNWGLRISSLEDVFMKVTGPFHNF